MVRLYSEKKYYDMVFVIIHWETCMGINQLLFNFIYLKQLKNQDTTKKRKYKI